jgi:hypothetical protein
VHDGGAVASGDDEVSSAVATSALLSRPGLSLLSRPGPPFCGGLRDVRGYMQRRGAQRLYFCTSKASKLRTFFAAGCSRQSRGG